uniref:PrdX deacylase domain-containing protein 1 n=1 Tax=Ciona intestinalis TaxID=7719 RepID=H2XP53_CIOIN|nr:prolyl-tRNA synthetase associated domain-containing protein 1 [Ciona intestinalis]|eukprot:XP_018670702.1 prolyl-tRNA synthetase associated domain-containing protein 1 [Ciona intestinalis]
MEALLQVLKSLNITTKLITHPEVFTVEAMMPYLTECSGVVCKNLFVKDKKKKKLWLIVAKHDRKINLGDIAKKLSVSGGFRFADEQVLIDTLGVSQGCVTPLAVCNDKESSVQLILDNILVSDPETMIYCHPMVNTATIGMKSADFQLFLEHTKHKPLTITFDEE